MVSKNKYQAWLKPSIFNDHWTRRNYVGMLPIEYESYHNIAEKAVIHITIILLSSPVDGNIGAPTESISTNSLSIYQVCEVVRVYPSQDSLGFTMIILVDKNRCIFIPSEYRREIGTGLVLGLEKSSRISPDAFSRSWTEKWLESSHP